MSKLIRLIVLSSFVFSLSIMNPILAHGDDEDGAQHRLEELREKREAAQQRTGDKREENQQKREEVRAIAEEKLEIAKQKIAERIKKIFATILRRLNAALARLDNIAERIATRIDKLNEKGVDTSAAENALEEAESKGAAASEAVDGAAAAIEAIDTTELGVREAMSEARTAITQAKNSLKLYHKALVEAIRELKASAELREGTQEADVNEE